MTDEDVGAEVDDLAEDEAGGSGMATKTRMAMGELIDELVRLMRMLMLTSIGEGTNK